MSADQFRREYFPIPHRGLSSIGAVEFLRREFAATPSWTCWAPGYVTCRLLGQIAGKGQKKTGRIGRWSWTRMPSAYPQLAFWDGYSLDRKQSDNWVGVLKIRGDHDEEFLLFSFLNSQGEIGRWYLASTLNVRVLDRFARAVHDYFVPSDRLIIRVQGGPNIQLNPNDDETIFLPVQLRRDIEQQVNSFFANAARYRQLRLRHRRGFLFVGRPGVGKSMMLRHLVRWCHRRHEIAVFMLNITRDMNDGDVAMLFREAEHHAPCLVILEDLDSMATECRVSRAHLLAQLDGLDSKEGLLVIGTTNNPENMDPALVHRPSRFDRVWHFELPDHAMRQRYLEWAFLGAEVDTAVLAAETAGWSFAYLNELRTTAAILAMDRNATGPTTDDLHRAFALLSPQFQAGRKNHVVAGNGELTGFLQESR